MSALRSSGLVFNLEDYPPLGGFSSENLPNWHEVIRRVSTVLENQDRKCVKTACFETSKELELTWIAQNVYAIGLRHIKEKVLKKYQDFIKHRDNFHRKIRKILQQKEELRTRRWPSTSNSRDFSS